MTKVLAGIIIIILVALGAGAFLVLSDKNKPATTDTSLNGNTQMQANTENDQKSLKDLIGLGSSQECSFKDAAGNAGTVYVGSNKMRGNFTTAGAQGSISSHIIVDGQTTYMWLDGQNTGYKLAFDMNAPAAAEAEKQTGQNVDLDQKVDYNCKAWTVNSSVFALPSGITFTDFGSMMVPSDKCAACDNVPASAQAQCKAALGCN